MSHIAGRNGISPPLVQEESKQLADTHRVRAESSPPTDERENRSHDLDEAYVFLTQSSNNHDEAGAVVISTLRRKVDWRIVPFLTLCYTVGFIDKVSLNYAAVMGLNKDLGLKGNDFSNAGTAFFAAYMIAEVPTVFILHKVPVAKLLGVSIVCWGIATACIAATTNYSTLLAARIFLGMFEAPVGPCLTLICSQWYTKSEQASRFALWYCGLGTGQIVGGLASFAFQHVERTTFQGWRIMFVVLGCVTVLLGFSTLAFLPDTPMTARFLSKAEKSAVLTHVSVNRTGVLNRRFKLAQIWEALLDVQLWLLTLITVLPSISSGVVTSYSATLIKSLGYSPRSAALLNMPSGAVSIISTLVAGYGIQHTSNRWRWFVAVCIPGIIGAGLMSFLPKHNQAGLLIGVYLVNSIVPTLFIVYQWVAANVAGHTKRAFSTSLIAAAFGVGNVVGPQTFQAKDAPQYHPAKVTVLATQGASAVVAVVLFAYYVWANARRERKDPPSEASVMEETKWENLTDKESYGFRYVY